MPEPSVLGIVLAGGAGTRLSPLTADRAKPAVPFGGGYRLIDFALSNMANGGIRKICVLTQYKSHSLDRHISSTWRMSSLLGNYVTPVPAQQRLGPHWYTGSEAPAPAAQPGRPRAVLPVDGQLRVRHQRARGRAAQGRRRRLEPARHGRQH